MTVWPVPGTARRQVSLPRGAHRRQSRGKKRNEHTRRGGCPPEHTPPRATDWELPLVFFGIVLALWVGGWVAVYLLVSAIRFNSCPSGEIPVRRAVAQACRPSRPPITRL